MTTELTGQWRKEKAAGGALLARHLERGGVKLGSGVSTVRHGGGLNTFYKPGGRMRAVRGEDSTAGDGAFKCYDYQKRK
jgi:hypothetical protein